MAQHSLDGRLGKPRRCSSQPGSGDRPIHPAYAVAGFAGVSLENPPAVPGQRVKRGLCCLGCGRRANRGNRRSIGLRRCCAEFGIRLHLGLCGLLRLQAGQIGYQFGHLRFVHGYSGHASIAHLVGGVMQQIGQLVARKLVGYADERGGNARPVSFSSMARDAGPRHEELPAGAGLGGG